MITSRYHRSSFAPLSVLLSTLGSGRYWRFRRTNQLRVPAGSGQFRQGGPAWKLVALSRPVCDGINVTQDQVYIRALAVDFFISLLNTVEAWAERTLAEIETWDDLLPSEEKNTRGLEKIRQLPVATPPSHSNTSPNPLRARCGPAPDTNLTWPWLLAAVKCRLAARPGGLRERRFVCRGVVHRATAQALTQTEGVSAMMRSSVHRPIWLMAGLISM
jgi:hypothetical protein